MDKYHSKPGVTLKRLFLKEKIIIPATDGEIRITDLILPFPLEIDSSFQSLHFTQFSTSGVEAYIYQTADKISLSKIIDLLRGDIRDICLTPSQIVRLITKLSQSPNFPDYFPSGVPILLFFNQQSTAEVEWDDHRGNLKITYYCLNCSNLLEKVSPEPKYVRLIVPAEDN